jgi:O-antigen/teichoic acid export membrane protein
MIPLPDQPPAQPDLSNPGELLEPELPPPAPPHKGTGKLVIAGTIWLLVQTLGSKVVTLGGQVVLGWLLSPDDFGQIGLAYTITAFAALLINPGIDVILVRRGRRFHLWSTPAFYFSLAAGLLGCLAILIAAPFAARLFGSQQLVGLLAVLAVATPIGSMMLVPTAKLRSELRFGAISVINVLQSTLQTLMTLAFAFLNFGVYSFVLPMPFVYAASTAMLWYVARPDVRLRDPFRHWRYLIGDTSYIFAQRVLQTAVSQGDYIVLGALFGAAVVGPYFFAFGIATQAIRLTAGSLQLVLLAGLSRFATHSAQQTQAALKATSALALVGTPLCFIQAAVAGPLLRALYGDKWETAIPLVQLISVGLAFDVASWPVGSLLQSRGKFRFLFYWSATLAPIFLVAITVGALTAGSLGVATAVCLFYAIFSPPLAFWTFRTSGISWSDIAAVFLRPTAVGLLAAAATVVSISLTALVGLPPLVQCGFGAGLGILTMVVGARAITPVIWHDVAARIQQVIPVAAYFKS